LLNLPSVAVEDRAASGTTTPYQTAKR